MERVQSVGRERIGKTERGEKFSRLQEENVGKNQGVIAGQGSAAFDSGCSTVNCSRT